MSLSFGRYYIYIYIYSYLSQSFLYYRSIHLSMSLSLSPHWLIYSSLYQFVHVYLLNKRNTSVQWIVFFLNAFSFSNNCNNHATTYKNQYKIYRHFVSLLKIDVSKFCRWIFLIKDLPIDFVFSIKYINKLKQVFMYIYCLTHKQLCLHQFLDKK